MSTARITTLRIQVVRLTLFTIGVFLLSACQGLAPYDPVQANVLLRSDGTGEMNWASPLHLSDDETDDAIRLYVQALGLPEPDLPFDTPLQLDGLERDEIVFDLGAFVRAVENAGLSSADSIFVSICVPPSEGRVTGSGTLFETLWHESCVTFSPNSAYSSGTSNQVFEPQTVTVSFEERSASRLKTVAPMILMIFASVGIFEVLIRRKSDDAFRILAFAVGTSLLLIVWLLGIQANLDLPSGFDAATVTQTGIPDSQTLQAGSRSIGWFGRRLIIGIFTYFAIRFLIAKPQDV